MTVHHETFTLDTRGDGEVIDVTDLAEKAIANSGRAPKGPSRSSSRTAPAASRSSSASRAATPISTPCSRASHPRPGRWEHNERNADTNGHSHARAGIIGPSVTVPLTGAEMMLGVWQRVICVDFDDRAAQPPARRHRRRRLTRPGGSAPGQPVEDLDPVVGRAAPPARHRLHVLVEHLDRLDLERRRRR